MLPSWALFGLIIIGGAVVVVANTLYPLSKAQEDKAKLAADAKAILLPEIKRNAQLVTGIEQTLSSGQIPLTELDVTAWETISKGGLLLGLKAEDISKLLRAYNLIYRANELIAKILDLGIGVASAMSSSATNRQVMMNTLSTTLKELDPLLGELKNGV